MSVTVWKQFLWLAAAGAAGTVSRYLISHSIQRWAGHGFPWGTLTVNMIGCFLFGMLWSLFEHRFAVLGPWRAAVFVGFLGSFTTFSSFAHDTGALLRASDWVGATLNVIIQNSLGLVLLFWGAHVGHSIR